MFPQDAGRSEDEGGRGFRRARRAASLARLGVGLRRRLTGRAPCCEALRSFEEELAGRGLVRRDRKFETVEINSIVGSVGRAGAFDAWFLPICSCTQERWRRIYEAFLQGWALPPVELYKLADAYFVVDGNHRVSVARYRGMVAVDALVTEFV